MVDSNLATVYSNTNKSNTDFRYSFIHSFILTSPLSFILSFVLSFIHSFIHSSFHTFFHSFILTSISFLNYSSLIYPLLSINNHFYLFISFYNLIILCTDMSNNTHYHLNCNLRNHEEMFHLLLNYDILLSRPHKSENLKKSQFEIIR